MGGEVDTLRFLPEAIGSLETDRLFWTLLNSRLAKVSVTLDGVLWFSSFSSSSEDENGLLVLFIDNTGGAGGGEAVVEVELELVVLVLCLASGEADAGPGAGFPLPRDVFLIALAW